MAFDYGSIDLGLKNPFKLEGKITAVRGAIQSALGLYLLISAAAIVKEDAGVGWILMIFGFFILGTGIRVLSGGVYAILRYFVGRNHPTSLAENFSKSESSTAHEETPYVGYSSKQLEEMLVGRKNITYVEPQGFLARILHSFVPKLLYMPYPIRNMAQNLFMAWVNTAVSLLLYGLVAFVSLSGFAGDAGELAFPVYSAVLVCYLLVVWFQTAKPVARNAEKNVDVLGVNSLVKIIVISIVLPVVTGLFTSWFMSENGLTRAVIEGWLLTMPDFHAGYYLCGVLLGGVACTIPIILMLQKRLGHNSPVSEVSELRENWQESVHPNEIFINLDNLVMANLRYKEVPNRVYRELDPHLEEQVDSKGSFAGEMIQEVQPKVKPIELGHNFSSMRIATLTSGNVLFVISMAFSLLLAYAVVDFYTFATSSGQKSIAAIFYGDDLVGYVDKLLGVLHMLLIGVFLKSFASLLSNSAHLFFAEIQFESLLVYFRCEGTFTESKISTGTGIHDSTRSENTLIRSSITPWVIVSRIVSTTFAATGMRNLEYPRYILEMHKDDFQLQEIRKDVTTFLKDRESIAAITNEKDLGNASQIHQLNQQTRATSVNQSLENDEKAAGYLRKEGELEAVQDG